MRDIKAYFNRPKKFDPIIKFKYALGLGDAISFLLHSKWIGPVTYLITGKIEPCNECNNRRVALNVLFPIPFWKIFFKDGDAYQKHLDKEYEDFGVFTDQRLKVFQKIEQPKTVTQVFTLEDMIK